MDNSLITQFDDIEMIAGNNFSLEFEVNDENDKPVNLTGAKCTVTLAPIGNLEFAILKKDGIIYGIDSNCFRALFTGDDTRDLYSKYIYQPSIVDMNGKDFCRAQGTIYFSERIK